MSSLDAVEVELRAWYDVYFADFKAVCGEEHADPHRWIEYYIAPLTIASDAGYQVIPDQETVNQRQLAAVEEVRNRNYDHSEMHWLNVAPVNTRAALITGEFSRHDRDGNEFARFKTGYLAVKTDAGWKFTATMRIAE